MSKICNFFLLYFFIHLPLNGQNFVLFTQMKTGTHLVMPILEDLMGKKAYHPVEFMNRLGVTKEEFERLAKEPQLYFYSMGEYPWKKQVLDQLFAKCRDEHTFLHLHAPFTKSMEFYLATQKCINFFIKRDPRDQLISLWNHFKLRALMRNEDVVPYILKMRTSILRYIGWLESPLCVVLDFNKLMGAHGGVATDKDALGEIRKITSALGLTISDRQLSRLYKENFGKSGTFFTGKVGVWKEFFNSEEKALIKSEVGDLLIKLGYEKDNDW